MIVLPLTEGLWKASSPAERGEARPGCSLGSWKERPCSRGWSGGDGCTLRSTLITLLGLFFVRDSHANHFPVNLSSNCILTEPRDVGRPCSFAPGTTAQVRLLERAAVPARCVRFSSGVRAIRPRGRGRFTHCPVNTKD